MTPSLLEASRGFVCALEGSTPVATCAIRDPEGSIVELAAPPGSRHVEALPSLVAETATRAGVALARLALVVVGSGPGSYMGIRATVAVANALSYAAGCPVAEISTLDSLGIAAARSDRDTSVAIPAGRGRSFVASYRELGGVVQRTGEPELVDDAALPGLDRDQHPSARGHLEAIAGRPEWARLEPVAGARPRYGPSGGET